jgi:hypothetical protein
MSNHSKTIKFTGNRAAEGSPNHISNVLQSVLFQINQWEIMKLACVKQQESKQQELDELIKTITEMVADSKTPKDFQTPRRQVLEGPLYKLQGDTVEFETDQRTLLSGALSNQVRHDSNDSHPAMLHGLPGGAASRHDIGCMVAMVPTAPSNAQTPVAWGGTKTASRGAAQPQSNNSYAGALKNNRDKRAPQKTKVGASQKATQGVTHQQTKGAKPTQKATQGVTHKQPKGV